RFGVLEEQCLLRRVLIHCQHLSEIAAQPFRLLTHIEGQYSTVELVTDIESVWVRSIQRQAVRGPIDRSYAARDLFPATRLAQVRQDAFRDQEVIVPSVRESLIGRMPLVPRPRQHLARKVIAPDA